MKGPRQGLILAAGRGARMGGSTDDLPKALLRLGREPLLERQLHQMGARGIERVVVVTGYRSEDLRLALC